MSSDEPMFNLLTNFSDSLVINEEEKKNTEENIKFPNYHVLADEKSEKNEKDLPKKKVASIIIKKGQEIVEYAIEESG